MRGAGARGKVVRRASHSVERPQDSGVQLNDSDAQFPPSFDDGRPEFDHAFARELIGKYVLVGLTVQDKRGEFKRHEQVHGVVTSADAADGIYLALKGSRDGETQWLPPATHVYTAALKGEYRLTSSGEVVMDPDFTTQWIVAEPDA